MATTFAFGDLVALRGEPAVGIIAELRRQDCRVQYLREGRSVWIELRALRPAGDSAPAGSLERLVHELLRLLGASEFEFVARDPSRCRLVASHGAIAPDRVDGVRGMLGERLSRFVIRPQGMHRIQSCIDFRF